MLSTGHHQWRTPSVEDYLGPAEDRFFGAGYRRVDYELSPVRRTSTGRASGRAAVCYPVDWSTKATGRPLRPHLSTIDALILGARIAARVVPTADEDGPLPSLRQAHIKAGSTPFETGMDSVPLEAALMAPGKPGEAGLAATVVESKVGNMRCRFEFADPSPSAAGAQHPDCFRERSQTIDEVRLDMTVPMAAARVSVSPMGIDRCDPLLAMLDSFVVSLQLGQVLLYELDGIERQASNTLWMRSTTIRCDRIEQSVTQPVPVTASLLKPRLLNVLGHTWRAAEIVSRCAGLETRCAVAHRLPDGLRQPTFSF